MNKPFLILLLFIKLFAFSQNLVPNPSFEDTIYCPTNSGELIATKFWYSPTAGTSDYFNRCSDQNIGIKIPNTGLGYQNTSGNGYTGMQIFFDPYGADWIEYIQVQLIEPLKADYLYNFSFLINLANTSNYAIEKIGAWMTPNSVVSNSTSKLFSSPPTVQNVNGYLKDTLNWMTVSGQFIANGVERYLTIGSYSDTINLDTISIDSGNGSIISYYYIDSIALTEITPKIDIPNIFTPNNDGANDICTYKQIEGVMDFNISVLNRWGNLVYYDENNFLWDGTDRNGKLLSAGTYYYILNYNHSMIKKGFIQLIR